MVYLRNYGEAKDEKKMQNITHNPERKQLWLTTHLETFVKPYLGYIPVENNLNKTEYFTPEEMSVIKSVWKSVKNQAKGKNLILAGRDVYIFEILARREGYPTRFISECSLATVSYLNIEGIENSFLFDTGFVGTIPIKLGINHFSLL